jgi:4a-hydroxytetrahydrobiopterin dehydratase
MAHYPTPYRPKLALEQAFQLGWRAVDPNSLVRELRFRDFPDAFAFVTQIAERAVDYNSRPDMTVYGLSRVRLTIANSHHAGLTAAELRLLEKVEAVISEWP